MMSVRIARRVLEWFHACANCLGSTLFAARLIDRLNVDLSRTPSALLISSPTGFGITTVVGEWISTLTPSPLPKGEGAHSAGVRIARLRLDEGDSDLAHFLRYVV